MKRPLQRHGNILNRSGRQLLTASYREQNLFREQLMILEDDDDNGWWSCCARETEDIYTWFSVLGNQFRRRKILNSNQQYYTYIKFTFSFFRILSVLKGLSKDLHHVTERKRRCLVDWRSYTWLSACLKCLAIYLGNGCNYTYLSLR